MASLNLGYFLHTLIYKYPRNYKFICNEKALNKIAIRMMCAGLEKINKSFEVSHN